MNTSKLLSLFVVMGLAASPALALDISDANDIARGNIAAAEVTQPVVEPVAAAEVTQPVVEPVAVAEVTQPVVEPVEVAEVTQPVIEPVAVAEVTQPVVKPVEIAEVTPEALGTIETWKARGATVLELAKDHKYVSAGVVAVVALAGIEYFVFKNGNIKKVANFVKEHKITSGAVALGVTGLAAAQYNGNIEMRNWIPSWETVQSYLGWKTAAVAGTASLISGGAYKYYNKPVQEQQPTPSQKDQQQQSWRSKLPGMPNVPSLSLPSLPSNPFGSRKKEQSKKANKQITAVSSTVGKKYQDRINSATDATKLDGIKQALNSFQKQLGTEHATLLQLIQTKKQQLSA